MYFEEGIIRNESQLVYQWYQNFQKAQCLNEEAGTFYGVSDFPLGKPHAMVLTSLSTAFPFPHLCCSSLTVARSWDLISRW